MEKAEFQKIAEKYIDVVYRSALSVCNSKSDAEDAVQNAFCKLLKSDTKFENEEHIRRWLVKVAINECKMMWRSYWHRNVISFEELNIEPSYLYSENTGLFEQVMKLPPKYRVVLHLYYYEDYSCNEIAQILKISQTAVQTRLMRARAKLKEELKEV